MINIYASVFGAGYIKCCGMFRAPASREKAKRLMQVNTPSLSATISFVKVLGQKLAYNPFTRDESPRFQKLLPLPTGNLPSWFQLQRLGLVNVFIIASPPLTSPLPPGVLFVYAFLRRYRRASLQYNNFFSLALNQISEMTFGREGKPGAPLRTFSWRIYISFFKKTKRVFSLRLSGVV
jgi:hypothetical protein